MRDRKNEHINAGFLSVLEWNGAQCSAATIPIIRKHEDTGMKTKAFLQCWRHSWKNSSTK